jgi:hypothetical protein
MEAEVLKYVPVGEIALMLLLKIWDRARTSSHLTGETIVKDITLAIAGGLHANCSVLINNSLVMDSWLGPK